MVKHRRWGSGTVYRRAGDGRWVAAARDGNKRRTRYASTRPEAIRLLAELRREIAAREAPIDRKTTVGQALLAWLAGRRPVVGPSSYVRYEELVRLQLGRLARIRLVDLTPEDVRGQLRYLEEHGSAAATIRGALRIVRATLELAVADGQVPRNVAKSVSPPRSNPKRGSALTAVQAAALLEAARADPLYPLWALMLGTGLRMGEALGLRWADVDLQGSVIRVTGAIRHQSPVTRGTGPRLQRVAPKTEAGRRVVALPAFAAAAIAQLPTDALYVFHRGHGRPMNPSTVQRAFADLVARADLPAMRLHDLRHTAATLMIASGATLDDVKRAMGHSSIAITSDTYGHLVVERAQELAKALDRAVG